MSSDGESSSSAALFSPRCLDRAAAYRMLYTLKSHLQGGIIPETLVRHRGQAGTKTDTHSLDRLSKCVWMLFCKAWSVGKMAADLRKTQVSPSLQTWGRRHQSQVSTHTPVLQILSVKHQQALSPHHVELQVSRLLQKRSHEAQELLHVHTRKRGTDNTDWNRKCSIIIASITTTTASIINSSNIPTEEVESLTLIMWYRFQDFLF